MPYEVHGISAGRDEVKTVGGESKMEIGRTVRTSASRTTESVMASAMMILTLRGVMYPYTATSSMVYSKFK